MESMLTPTNESIEREVLRRVTARVHSSQLVAGDFQGPISEGLLGGFLLQAGWNLFTQCWVGEKETNRPPHGRARMLDEVAMCLGLRHQLREVDKEWPEGFSTHALITVTMDQQGRTVKGRKQVCTWTKAQLESKVRQAREKEWPTGEVPGPQGDASTRYRSWLHRLKVWLDIREEDFGRLELKDATTKEGAAPIKASGLVRLNRDKRNVSVG